MRAARRHEPLKELFARAVAHEVEAPPAGRPRGRLALPLIGHEEEPETVELTGADIEAAFEAEDIERYGR
ncbi:MAG: hypothetical protein ACRDN9_15455 [Streptosporangiaceae bacterium]